MTTLPSWMLHRISTCAGVLPCACGDRGDGRVVEQLADAQRAVGLGDDVVLGVDGAQLGLVQQRVQLDLVDRGAKNDRSMMFDRCSAWKLHTPIDRVWPTSLAFISPPQLSTYLPCSPAGQWIRYRST